MATLEIRGLEEFRTALRNLPEDLANEGDVIVQAHAEDAQRTIRDGYPTGPTGNLQRGVQKELNRSKFGTSAIVRSRAKHASIFEKGTRQRQTRAGANRGAMPKAPDAEAFIPKAIRVRRRMVNALVELVRRAGFEVNL